MANVHHVFVWLTLMFSSVIGEYDTTVEEYFVQDDTIEGHRLQNSLLRDLTTLSLVDCCLECVREICCTSINFRKNTSQEKNPQENCELNKRPHPLAKVKLIKDKMYFHYQVLSTGKDNNFCCSSPCLHGGSCDTTSEKCLCNVGFGGRYCEAIGSTPDLPAISCNEIHFYDEKSPSGYYWINPSPGTNKIAFRMYCDMVTQGGGWTLVYKYKFTNYTNYSKRTNAVTPRPNWYAWAADVPVSTQPPSQDNLGAISYEFWEEIGAEFLITSSINDWIVCSPIDASIVWEHDGYVDCINIKNVAPDCESIAPDYIDWGMCGPRLKSETSYYRFDGSVSDCYPTHDPCNDDSSTLHHKKGVANPGGAIYLR